MMIIVKIHIWSICAWRHHNARFVSHLEHDSGYNLTEKTDDRLMVVYCGHHIRARHHTNHSPGLVWLTVSKLSARPDWGSIQRIGKLCQFLCWATARPELTTQEQSNITLDPVQRTEDRIILHNNENWHVILHNWNIFTSDFIVLRRRISVDLDFINTSFEMCKTLCFDDYFLH